MIFKPLILASLALSLFLSAMVQVSGDDPNPEKDRSEAAYGGKALELVHSRTDAASRMSDHPLVPILHFARAGYQSILEDVRDYSCVLIKRERVDGRLLGPEVIFAKVRHEQVDSTKNEVPFGLYLKFQSPTDRKGREILFLRRAPDDKLLVRNGGKRLAFITLELEPTCPLAMNGNRYPVTEFGIQRLVERMLDLGEKELAYDECNVTIDPEAGFDDVSCTRIEIAHPVRRDHFEYHLARIYIDNRLRLPIRFEAYDWPAEGSEEPVLIEEYTYRDLQLNVGLTDADFARDNPEYGFRQRD